MPLVNSRNQDIPLNGYLKVQVSDTGVGIPSRTNPQSYLICLSKPMDGSAGNMYGGTGLGLWICKQICQKMNGDIALYSEVNRGTTFVFYIPVDNDEAQCSHYTWPQTRLDEMSMC